VLVAAAPAEPARRHGPEKPEMVHTHMWGSNVQPEMVGSMAGSMAGSMVGLCGSETFTQVDRRLTMISRYLSESSST